jgi:Holliday junction resolvase RusA-like endonuclease
VSSWAFIALGEPAPQGSKRAIINPHTGFAQVVDSNPARLRPWRQTVTYCAPSGPSLLGPVALYVVFTVKRPSTARKRDTTPERKPDLDKLLRSALDSITDAGLWTDDGQVAEIVRCAKVWPGYDDHALDSSGIVVAAIEMSEPQWHAELMMKVDVKLQHYRLDRHYQLA